MMTEIGHTVIHYGHEESDLTCTEHVTVLSSVDWKVSYGDHDWRKHFFKYDLGDHAYQTFYRNAINEIQTRKQKNDFILPFWGSGVRTICDAHPDLICVEPGIGYSGGHWARFKIFESYAIYHAYYGLESVGTCKQDWYDVVIPNYFDPDDFTYKDTKEDYFLFIGRVYEGKGIHIAIQATKEIGARLKVAGQNSLQDCGYDMIPDHVDVIGYADVETRRELMANAKGAFVASLYNEPFGGVQVECLFSGTPTITTDWGAFTENNIHGVTGYRCRTFEQFTWAAKNIDRINPQNCRDWAMNNFSMNRVAKMYEEYFQSVLNIHTGNGWYEPNDTRDELDWLRKIHPTHQERCDYTGIIQEETKCADHLADWISNYLKPASVFDIGCGPGIYVESLRQRGIEAYGADIDVRVRNKPYLMNSSVFDLDKSQQELVICFEMAEHISSDKNDMIVDCVYNKIAPNGLLIWSAAAIGQGGIGHINCQDRSFWQQKFIDKGLKYEEPLHNELLNHLVSGWHMGWLRNNCLVFSKPIESIQ
jgi:glycosyltransferase involved in cell wall biosynthesis